MDIGYLTSYEEERQTVAPEDSYGAPLANPLATYEAAKPSTEPLVVRSRNFNGSDYPVVRISTRLLSELVILLTVVEYGKNWTITMQKETAVTGR